MGLRRMRTGRMVRHRWLSTGSPMKTTNQTNNMTYISTHHCSERMSQRGITPMMVEKGFEIGHAIQKQGLDMIVVRKKDIPQGMNRQLAGRLNGLVLLVSESNVVLTAYKNSKTASRDLKKKDKRNMKKAQHMAA